MSRKRPGWRAAERTFKSLSRDLERKAHESRYAAALRLCLREIEQFHSTAYPDCDGGCPAHEAMAAAKAALGSK
jgi:hypothetical protein